MKICKIREELEIHGVNQDHHVPMFFEIWDVELLVDSQRGTQTPPKSVVDEGGVKHHFRDK